MARLVHVSGIGADPGSRSAYIRARGMGETAVRQAFPEATIIRPSAMFGPEDAFLTTLANSSGPCQCIPCSAGEGRGCNLST